MITCTLDQLITVHSVLISLSRQRIVAAQAFTLNNMLQQCSMYVDQCKQINRQSTWLVVHGYKSLEKHKADMNDLRNQVVDLLGPQLDLGKINPLVVSDLSSSEKEALRPFSLKV